MSLKLYVLGSEHQQKNNRNLNGEMLILAQIFKKYMDGFFSNKGYFKDCERLRQKTAVLILQKDRLARSQDRLVPSLPGM